MAANNKRTRGKKWRAYTWHRCDTCSKSFRRAMYSEQTRCQRCFQAVLFKRFLA